MGISVEDYGLWGVNFIGGSREDHERARGNLYKTDPVYRALRDRTPLPAGTPLMGEIVVDLRPKNLERKVDGKKE